MNRIHPYVGDLMYMTQAEFLLFSGLMFQWVGELGWWWYKLCSFRSTVSLLQAADFQRCECAPPPPVTRQFMCLVCAVTCVHLLQAIACLCDLLHSAVQSGCPWWLSGKESSCHCRRHSLDPSSGKQPSLYATATETALQNPQAMTSEAHVRLEKPPQ